MTTCIVCGCTDDNACVSQFSPYEEPVACSWVHADGEEPLCSFCAENEPEHEQLVDAPRQPRIILPGDPEYFL